MYLYCVESIGHKFNGRFDSIDAIKHYLKEHSLVFIEVDAIENEDRNNDLENCTHIIECSDCSDDDYTFLVKDKKRSYVNEHGVNMRRYDMFVASHAR